MKRLLVLMLILALAAALFSGCGKEPADGTDAESESVRADDIPDVITSALKDVGEAAYLALEAAFGIRGDWAEWSGDNCMNLGAAEGCVGLPVDTWSLQNWSVDEYRALPEKLAAGEIQVDDNRELASTDYVTLHLTE